MKPNAHSDLSPAKAALAVARADLARQAETSDTSKDPSPSPQGKEKTSAFTAHAALAEKAWRYA